MAIAESPVMNRGSMGVEWKMAEFNEQQGARGMSRLTSGQEQAGWALGLRQLYHGVTCEPVPAELADLLACLQAGSGNPGHPEYSG